ncbi:MAG: GerMN domain-containing protein [Deltaproteobacteria bacterium]|nr:GerMN domain-containing protein [Deltaproteobacteria bacterium]
MKGPAIIALAIGLGFFLTGAAFGQRVSLLFPFQDATGLGLEKRSVELKEGLANQAREIILALLAGPRTRLASVFGPGEHLRQVFVNQAGIAYVDLAESAVKGSAAGVMSARLRLWSLVNSICINLEAVKAVKILVGGQEVSTFMGHIDISRPLYPDYSLIPKDGQPKETE